MNTETQTDQQIATVALEYTLLDFKRSLIVVSVLMNATMFITWLTVTVA